MGFWNRTYTPDELMEETRWWLLLAGGLLLQLGALHSIEALRHGDWTHAKIGLGVGAGVTAAGCVPVYLLRAACLVPIAAFFTSGAAQGRLAPLAALAVVLYYLLAFIRFRPKKVSRP